MAHVRKGHLTPAPQWAKHQRPDWKRVFWSRERQAAKEDVAERLEEGMMTQHWLDADSAIHAEDYSKAGANLKTYVVEYRIRPEKMGSWMSRLIGNDWRKHRAYHSETAREMALSCLSRKETFFEFRKGE